MREREREREKERESLVDLFYTISTFAGLFHSDICLTVSSPVYIYGTKIYLHNNFKWCNGYRRKN